MGGAVSGVCGGEGAQRGRVPQYGTSATAPRAWGTSSIIRCTVMPFSAFSNGGTTSVPSSSRHAMFMLGPSLTLPCSSTNMPCERGAGAQVAD